MRRLKQYMVVWLALVVLFNLLSFVTPSELYGISKYSGGFWTGYAFAMLAFVLHLAYAIFCLC